MATITNSLLSKPPPSPSLPKQPTPLFFRPTTSSSSSSSSPRLTKPSPPLVARPHRRRGITLRATAATQDSPPPARDERVQQVHSMEEFDEALRAAQNRLVVVEYLASHSASSSRMYPFMVELSRQCSDVVFLLVMGDESEATRELCRREKVDKAPHFTFYKSMERVHDEEGIGPDQLVGDVLYYGDSHSAVEQLHSREDVEKLIEGHKADHKLIVLDVGLKHCGPCVKVYPTVIKLSKQMSDSVVFARMNGDENDSCMQFLKDMDVIEVPTFLFIRDGDIRGRYVGSGKGELIGEILRYQGVRVTY